MLETHLQYQQLKHRLFSMLPKKEVAFAAGFGSLRRFNDAFRKTYGRAPSGFRREG